MSDRGGCKSVTTRGKFPGTQVSHGTRHPEDTRKLTNGSRSEVSPVFCSLDSYWCDSPRTVMVSFVFYKDEFYFI